jgi:phosphotransferase system lactose/cellobiose-specific IIB subunit
MNIKKFRALVCCHAGIGSSRMLKVKVDQVIDENEYPIVTECGSLEALDEFDGNLVITMTDLALKLNNAKQAYSAVGITSILDKIEIKEKLSTWLEEHTA